MTIDFCVYTALTGDYEQLNDSLPLKFPNTRFICLTNNDRLTSKNWDIHKVTSSLTNLELSRHMKMFPDAYLGQDVETLYIDNTVELKHDPRALYEIMIGSKQIGFIRHSFHHSMEEELKSILANIKVEVSPIISHVQFLGRKDISFLEKHPIWGGIIARKKSSDEIVKFQEDWWELFCHNPQRDQLSLALSSSRFDFIMQIVNLDNHISPYHSWPNVYRVRESCGLTVDEVESVFNEAFQNNMYSGPTLKLRCVCGKSYFRTYFGTKLKTPLLRIFRKKSNMIRMIKQAHGLVQRYMALASSAGNLLLQILKLKPKRVFYPICHPRKFLSLVQNFAKKHLTQGSTN
jgi:hypothetical protein